MSDWVYFAAEVSRDALGQAPLNLNDHVSYIASDQILGGQQAWNKQTVKSPYVEGEWLVNATRGNVQGKFGVQVLGASQGILQTNIRNLLSAFCQLSYRLTVTQDDAVYEFDCQPADYTIDWTRERMMARKALVTLMVPRLPIQAGI